MIINISENQSGLVMKNLDLLNRSARRTTYCSCPPTRVSQQFSQFIWTQFSSFKGLNSLNLDVRGAEQHKEIFFKIILHFATTSGCDLQKYSVSGIGHMDAVALFKADKRSARFDSSRRRIRVRSLLLSSAALSREAVGVCGGESML